MSIHNPISGGVCNFVPIYSQSSFILQDQDILIQIGGFVCYMGVMRPLDAKILILWSEALYMALVVFGNLTDYGTNYSFVSQVMSMDGTFQTAMWRAVGAPFLHHVVYCLIILVEFCVVVLCALGGWHLLDAKQSGGDVNLAKRMGVAGLVLAFLLWFAGFLAIGGEWFLMWQAVGNAQTTAFHLAILTLVALIFLCQPDAQQS